jgi:probable rRNA maturation factor
MADGDSTADAATSTRRRLLGLAARNRQTLRIEILLPAGLRAPGLAAWLQAVAPARARGTLTVAVVPDARVRALNRDYRRKDTKTDVLSFPAEGPPDAGHHAGAGHRGHAEHPKPAGRTASAGPFLGDVVIAGGVARRQAHGAGHSLQTELRILALHGLLHLLGYDHEQDEGQMARLERRLRRKGGLREGLIERADS